MKKVLIIVAVLIILLFLAVGFITFSIIAKEKDSISAEEFKSLMEEKGHIIIDATSQYEEYEYVKKVYIATKADNKYQIEFYTLSDDEKAKYFYNTNKEIFEKSKSSATSQTSTQMKNYSKYTLNTDGKYKVISRINNTAIYINVDDEYKNIVKELLKEIGY